MMEKGLTLGMKGQPRKTFPQFIPKAQLNSERTTRPPLCLPPAARGREAVAVRREPQLAYKVAHDATPQLSWLMTSETESEDASV